MRKHLDSAIKQSDKMPKLPKQEMAGGKENMEENYRQYAHRHLSSPLFCAWMVFGTIVMAGIIILIVLLFPQSARAEEINVDRLADAIYKAENSKAHPYGIMVKYKHTTPRKACVNTINHALKDWNGSGDFVDFLQKRYAPIGVRNDPRNLNVNWSRNVHKFYAKGN